MLDMDNLVRTAEAARAIGVAPATLRRWRAEGKVKPVTRTVGGQDRWSIEDLRRQLERLTRQ